MDATDLSRRRCVLCSFSPLAAQSNATSSSATVPTYPPPQNPNLDQTLDAGESESDPPVRRLVKWNEFDGKHFTLRVGGGFLYEYAAYAQDDASKQQHELLPDDKVRDMRVLLKGRFKFFKKRAVTYSMGIMYDSANEEWVARQTGIMVDVPEIWGSLFVGRTKEGFSLK
jgi:phosphate-selective porin OprO/OprP